MVGDEGGMKLLLIVAVSAAVIGPVLVLWLVDRAGRQRDAMDEDR